MNVVLYQRYLHELQERYRYVHEANLAQLQKLLNQNAEQRTEQIQATISANKVDVKV